MSALAGAGKSAIGLLSLHHEFNRTGKEYGDGPAWIARSVGYLDKVLPQQAITAFPHQNLWLVVQGSTKEEESVARRIAAQTGAAPTILLRNSGAARPPNPRAAVSG